MKKRLVLITSGFPFGKSETFLETEITYLSDAFEEIIILCPETTEQILRKIPANCKVEFYRKEISKKDKLLALKGGFDKRIHEEKKIVKNEYQLTLSKGIVSTLLISLFQAKRIAKRIETLETFQERINDTVCYSYWCDDTALALALLKQKYPNLKCISRTHGWDVYFGVHELKYLPFRRLITENLDMIYPISDKGKLEIKNTWKARNFDNIHVARLGVLGQEQQKKEKSTQFTIVSCSNVIPLKRVELIAESVLNYKEGIKWIHFGDGPLLNKIQDLCNNKKTENHSIIFKGRVPNSEVMDFYKTKHVDVFINVSSSEGIPVSIMEAMSFGIPCIATDVGGNAEIVSNNNGVLLSENPTLIDVENAIQNCFKDESKRESAYQTWKQKYNAEKNYTAFVSKLKSL